MYSDATLWKVLVMDQVLLTKIHKVVPGGIVLKDCCAVVPHPENPSLVGVKKMDGMVYINGTFMRMRVDEAHNWYGAYQQEMTGIVRPGGMN